HVHLVFIKSKKSTKRSQKNLAFAISSSTARPIMGGFVTKKKQQCFRALDRH
ncbi:MAG: hypothetical protein ACI90V_012526, partial [Bacillariaceae sp.]